MKGPKVPSNRQVLRFFFFFLLSVGTELSQATGIVVEKVLAIHATATAKSQRRLEEDVSDLLKTASLPEKQQKLQPTLCSIQPHISPH